MDIKRLTLLLESGSFQDTSFLKDGITQDDVHFILRNFAANYIYCLSRFDIAKKMTLDSESLHIFLSRIEKEQDRYIQRAFYSMLEVTNICKDITSLEITDIIEKLYVYLNTYSIDISRVIISLFSKYKNLFEAEVPYRILCILAKCLNSDESIIWVKCENFNCNTQFKEEHENCISVITAEPPKETSERILRKFLLLFDINTLPVEYQRLLIMYSPTLPVPCNIKIRDDSYKLLKSCTYEAKANWIRQLFDISYLLTKKDLEKILDIEFMLPELCYLDYSRYNFEPGDFFNKLILISLPFADINKIPDGKFKDYLNRFITEKEVQKSVLTTAKNYSGASKYIDGTIQKPLHIHELFIKNKFNIQVYEEIIVDTILLLLENGYQTAYAIDIYDRIKTLSDESILAFVKKAKYNYQKNKVVFTIADLYGYIPLERVTPEVAAEFISMSPTLAINMITQDKVVYDEIMKLDNVNLLQTYIDTNKYYGTYDKIPDDVKCYIELKL